VDEEPIATLNVIPFVDIMLVLLTVVLTTANFITTGRIPVSLPQASRSHVEKHQDKDHRTDRQRRHSSRRRPGVEGRSWEPIASAARGHLVPIRADRNLAFQGFVDVADVLKRLNFTKVAAQTQTVSR
jgi:biopolymer transport protein ExbD